MAITFAITPRLDSSEEVQSLGSVLALFGELNFTGNYATGGVVVTAPDFKTIFKKIGAGKLLRVDFAMRLGYLFNYDYVNDKVMLFTAPDTEVAAGAFPASLVALTAGNRVKVIVFGR
jgi:hypothetical protein